MNRSQAGARADLLLVEDSPTDVLLVRAALEECALDIRVHVADSVAGALAFLDCGAGAGATPRPHAILLDLDMPVFSGHELLARLRGDIDLRGIPAIVFTTSDAEVDIRAAYAAGANCFVTKPRDFHAFAHAVRSVAAFWLSPACPPPSHEP